MTERSLTSALMTVLEVMYPKAEITKHSDRFTAGYPDLSIVVEGPTHYFEVKYVRRGSSLRAEVKPIQLLRCRRLERATRGRCWIVAYYEHPRRVALVRPAALAACRAGEPIPAHEDVGFNHSLIKKVIA
jgi:hypothetical protein